MSASRQNWREQAPVAAARSRNTAVFTWFSNPQNRDVAPFHAAAVDTEALVRGMAGTRWTRALVDGSKTPSKAGPFTDAKLAALQQGMPDNWRALCARLRDEPSVLPPAAVFWARKPANPSDDYCRRELQPLVVTVMPTGDGGLPAVTPLLPQPQPQPLPPPLPA